MRRGAPLAAALAALGCSGLLGLDDFKDAPATGGSAGSGASGGTTPTGGAAGTGAVPSGGGTGASGGAAGSGGTGPTGGTAGTGGSGATGGAAGSGGTGGKVNLVCAPAPGTKTEILIDKTQIPGDVSPRLALGADDSPNSPSAHLFVGHDWGAQAPSGRFDHELIAIRINDQGQVVGPAVVPIDMQVTFTPALAHVTLGATPQVTVLGLRQGVEAWTYPLDSSHALQLPPQGNLLTYLGQSKCSNAGPNAKVEAAAFTYEQNDVRIAAVCAGVGSGKRELWLVTGGVQDFVTSKPLTDPSIDPMGYSYRQGNNSRILWQNDDGFRVGTAPTDLANGPVYLNASGATSQSLIGMLPRKGGVVVFLQRTSSGGTTGLASAQLMEPYGTIPTAAVTDLAGPLPLPGFLQSGTTSSPLKALAGATPPDTSGTRHVRLLVVNETTGNVIFNGDAFGLNSDIQSASAVQIAPDKFLVVGLMSKGNVMGQVLLCK